MNPSEARQRVFDSLESDSLIAVIGMNSEKVANSVCKAIHQNMPKTTVEMGDNHGESLDTFLNAMLNHILEQKSTSYDILKRDFIHPYVPTAQKIIDINRTLVTDKYDRNPLDQLDINRRRMALQDNFNGIIENLGTIYPGKDFLILMKVSCDTNLTCQAMKRLKTVSNNPHIKIVLFIEMTPDFYNRIRENNMFDGICDSEINIQEE